MDSHRPIEPPTRFAPQEDRAEWSAQYVQFVIDHMPFDGPLPGDVRPTHLFEVEADDCTLDPQAYFAHTQFELRLH